jgi:hypothetical protein
MKTKLNNYNLVKGSLTQMQRKKTFVPGIHALKINLIDMLFYTVETFPSAL